MGGGTFIRNSSPTEKLNEVYSIMILFKKQNLCVSYLLNSQVGIEILVVHITWRERSKIWNILHFMENKTQLVLKMH
jgi:hypothetical protein